MKPMTPTEKLYAKWAMDAAADLRVGLDHFYIIVKLKKLAGKGMGIEQTMPYQQATLLIDPRILADEYEARLFLAHELMHLVLNSVTTSENHAEIDVACDRLAVLAVGRVPAPPALAEVAAQ